MHRLLTVALLAGGLLAGYAAGGGGRTEAQSGHASFPFRTGDTVRLQLTPEDRGGSPACIVESVTDRFVICKGVNDLPVAYNFRKVIKVTRVAAM